MHDVLMRPPTPEEWQRLQTLTYLFLTLVGVGWLGAGAFGLAHAIIPSLQYTHHAPKQLVALRPVLYVLAAILLSGAAFTLATIASQAGIGWELYPNKWI